MKTATKALCSVVAAALLAAALLAAALFAGPARAQDWPQFRGPNRDNKVIGFSALTTWPKELAKKWTVQVGEGESSPLLVGDRVYTFGRQGGDEVTTCLDAVTGKLIWQDKCEAEAVKGPASRYPGTRSTPAFAEGKICTLGVAGVVSCLDAAKGAVAWRIDTKSKPSYYTSSSPLIVDGKCIVYVGALTAFDLATGKAVWEWKDGKTPYGSPVLATIDGTKQIVTSAFGSIVGVGVADGKLLWKFPFGGAAYQGTYMTPIVDGRTVIYSAPGGRKGPGGGTVAIKIEKADGKFTATEVWKNKQAPYQYNTPVLRDGLIFGLSAGKSFFCMDAKTGDTLWTDDAKRGEAGAVLNAGAVMLALTGDSELVAFAPSNKTYTELASYKVSATPGLSYPIVAGHRVYVKGKDSLSLWVME
ncbi:MAG: PQQ-binding-like beta-propeller repeat protein [Gemmataceae bacterium]|nr:PQQ-binding-like beta-propeller repeat protein [Gemmataceae bacterium]